MIRISNERVPEGGDGLGPLARVGEIVSQREPGTGDVVARGDGLLQKGGGLPAHVGPLRPVGAHRLLQVGASQVIRLLRIG